MKPLVSVIIAAYNAEKYLDAAIASVVEQTVADWELLVVDDHSADGTLGIAQQWAQKDSRIQALHNEENQGVSRSRNRGIDLARGQYVAFLDADDTWYPRKLELQLEKFRQENVGIVYCSYDMVGPKEGRIVHYIVPESTCYDSQLRENVMACITMVIPTELMKRIGFKPEYYHEDYVLGLDILKLGYRAVGCTQPLAQVRRVETSRSFNKWKAAKNRWLIYRKYLHLPLHQAVAVFIRYAFGGVRKYFLGGVPKRK